MHPAAVCRRVAIGIMCVLACASTAWAQTSGYISGAIFADIRQFGSTTSQTPLFGLLSGSEAAIDMTSKLF